MHESTYPATGSKMELGVRHLLGYWGRTSFQKDNGHTESGTSVRRSDSASNKRESAAPGERRDFLTFLSGATARVATARREEQLLSEEHRAAHPNMG